MTTQEVQAYQERQPFNPNEHIIQIKNKQGNADYLPVQYRLVWFREQCPQGTIDTEEVMIDLDREFEAEVYAWNADTRRSEKVLKRAPGYARFRAIVTDGKGGRATATKTERGVDFPDYIEKAETGAIGRALAALGYGTQFAPELNEEHRIVDAPAERTEQDRRAYTERKAFVESTVSVKEEQPAQPKEERVSVGSLFERGKAEKWWPDADAFYQRLSEIFGKKVTRETVRTLTQAELTEASKQLYEQIPAGVTGAN